MSILSEILVQKQVEIASLDAKALRGAAEQSPPPRDFLAALLTRPSSVPSAEAHGRESSRISLIAELKRASPSKGVFAADLDLVEVAEIYRANGASAISVLTDQKYFLGNLETLHELRFTHQFPLPLLRKDFIIDEAQVYEARLHGADAVLLIASALPDHARLAELHALVISLGMTPLVEVHDAAETERALRLKDLKVIGINNRNLSTFETTLDTTEQLRPLIPAAIAVVAESGIFTAADVARLARANVQAVLVGEALITAGDIGAKVRELASADTAIISAQKSAAPGEARP